jgi:hypothetical protein
MNKILAGLSILYSSHLLAFDCGEYRIAGTVHEEEDNLIILIHEGTQSELKFQTTTKLQPQLIPYDNRPIEAIIKITKKMDGTHGEIDSIGKIELRIPNPLAPEKDTKFSLLKNKECEK